MVTLEILTCTLNLLKCITNDYLHSPLKQNKTLEHFNSYRHLQTLVLFYMSSDIFSFRSGTANILFGACLFSCTQFLHLNPSIWVAFLLPKVHVLEFPLLRIPLIAKSLSFFERHFTGYMTLGRQLLSHRMR